MSEKPYHKQEDGLILAFKDRAAHDRSGSAAPRWAGTDLARFAQDVVALNSESEHTHPGPRCQVAPLESMQRGLRIKKKAEEETVTAESPLNISRLRKE
jgi:hypothetical protein